MRSRRTLAVLVMLATLGAFVLAIGRMGGNAVHIAMTPSWPYLAAAFAVSAGVQPLRAWAWSSTLREPVGFRAVYAASAVGSFLDTVLPGRLGEASKVGVLKVAAGSRWPGFPRAGGSLLCAHLLEMIAFALVGAGAAFFLPIPTWGRETLAVGMPLLVVGVGAAATLRRRFGHRLPRALDAFLGGAAAPPAVLLRGGAILLATWLVRWFGVLLCLRSVGIHVGPGEALVYTIVTGLANTAPILPGNAGVYQGAAVGALAIVGHAGAKAVAVSLLAPVLVTAATGAAALVALALYGRRFVEISRGAWARA